MSNVIFIPSFYWIRTEDVSSMANGLCRMWTELPPFLVFVKFTHSCFSCPRLVKVPFRYFSKVSLASEATPMALAPYGTVLSQSLSPAVTLLPHYAALSCSSRSSIYKLLQFPFSWSITLFSDISKKLQYIETSGSAYPVTQYRIPMRKFLSHTSIKILTTRKYDLRGLFRK
jgi:hypothetical protein